MLGFDVPRFGAHGTKRNVGHRAAIDAEDVEVVAVAAAVADDLLSKGDELRWLEWPLQGVTAGPRMAHAVAGLVNDDGNARQVTGRLRRWRRRCRGRVDQEGITRKPYASRGVPRNLKGLPRNP
jgi:hypothetical protein